MTRQKEMLREGKRKRQEAFQFLLATAMHEAGKFELVSGAEVDGQWRYAFRCSAGDVFRKVM